MVGFRTLSREQGRSELDRLKYILSEYCDDWESIAAKFAPVVSIEAKAREIFQEHSKEGNPLQDRKWQDMVGCCCAGQTTLADFTAAKLCDTKQPYALLVSNVSAYWIYRVRREVAGFVETPFRFL